ncbi:transcription elongation regulator [Entophlyctis luteolus]|nr:transcription elongation regulator [Entophlyctis luteolus]KAJ3388750.1 transcription elongation regulator [Entophlyctis sp. JEL0112]
MSHPHPPDKVKNDPLDVDYDPVASRLQQQQQQPQARRRPKPPPPPAPSVRAPLPAVPTPMPIPIPVIPFPRPLPPTLADIEAAWTMHQAPGTGATYFYNHITLQSSWTPPSEFVMPQQQQPFPQQQQPLPPGTEPVMDQNAQEERAIALKDLPNSEWAIVLTSLDHEYFLNKSTSFVTWDIPDDVAELIGQIMAGSNFADEYPEDSDRVPPVLEDNSPAESKKLFDELQDEKELVRVYESSTSAAQMEAQMVEILRQQKAEQAAALTKQEEKLSIPTDNAAPVKRKQSVDNSPHSAGKKAKADAEPPLTTSEIQSMFLDMLEEYDTNAFSTWEKEQEQLVEDPRYIQVTSAKLRKHFYELYCKAKAAKIHQKRAEHETKTPREIFRDLLEEVYGALDWRRMGTLSAYDDFSRKWRRDARYNALGDDRDRKAMFKEFAAHLKAADAEKKKTERKKMQDGFFDLLREVPGISSDSKWRDIQRTIDRDSRYSAVPTPIQREDLFREFLKIIAVENAASEAERQEIQRKAREAESLREREEAVRKQKMTIARELKKSQYQLESGESASLFRTLLIDMIKSHRAKFKESLSYLATDARFDQIRLPEQELEQLFSEHTQSLFQKRLKAWHEFISEVTDITTAFQQVRDMVMADGRTARLECSPDEVEKLFSEHQHSREAKARSELDLCLKENGFVRFHVKNAVGSCQVQAVEKGLKEAPAGDEWRLIDLEEIKEVLKDDKRYNDFECFAQERERIVFSFLKQLVEEFRAEKGGVFDNTVSKFAGGNTDRKNNFKTQQ